MHHSFHGGGHLACSPSSFVLLHDRPPFPYRGLSRVLNTSGLVNITAQTPFDKQKARRPRPLRHGAGQELPTLLPSLVCIYLPTRARLELACGETGASFVAQDTIVNHNC